MLFGTKSGRFGGFDILRISVRPASIYSRCTRTFVQEVSLYDIPFSTTHVPVFRIPYRVVLLPVHPEAVVKRLRGLLQHGVLEHIGSKEGLFPCFLSVFVFDRLALVEPVGCFFWFSTSVTSSRLEARQTRRMSLDT